MHHIRAPEARMLSDTQTSKERNMSVNYAFLTKQTSVFFTMNPATISGENDRGNKYTDWWPY